MSPPRRIAASPARRRFLTAVGGALLGGTLGLYSFPAVASLDVMQLRRQMQEAYGRQGVAALDAWLALLEELADAKLATQLRKVNDFFNQQLRWLDDSEIWARDDYWATPLESLGRGQGDCEDFSIAKYVTLKLLGVPGARLRLIYVRARVGRRQIPQAHMVLGYYPTPSAEPLVLDNLRSSITSARQRTDLDPIFSFNSHGLWTDASQASRANPLRLSPWRRVVERMYRQGLS